MINNLLRSISFVIFLIAGLAANAQTDSITCYDFKSRTENVLIFKRSINLVKEPFFGKYARIDLTQYDSKIKVVNSDISPLLRTRDIFGGLDRYPISTVVKLIKLVNNKQVGTCTGTMVDGNYLITAAHCIKTDANEYPDKIVVWPLYDNDSIGFKKDTVSIEKMYYKKGYSKSESVEQLEEGNDITLYKLSKNIGEELGYIGLNGSLDPKKQKNKNIFSFSYPNESFMQRLEFIKQANKDNKELSAQLDNMIKDGFKNTPDFSKTNQYYKYGNIFEIKKNSYIKYRSGYSIAGESGSSWINSKYYLVGVLASQVENEVWAAGNSNLINAYITIILEK